MTIQDKLDGLSPFVTTIRYSERPIIDVSFPPTWGMPESKNVKVTQVKSDTVEISNYMVYGVEGIKVSIDDLLDFMSKAIILNKEREAKRSLLNTKIKELTALFDKTPLVKLTKMVFYFEEAAASPTISLGSVDEDESEYPIERSDKEVKSDTPTEGATDRTFVTDNGQKVDLPPKKKEKVKVEVLEPPVCNCAEGEMCPECVDI